MTQNAKELLTQITHHETMAAHHTTTAASLRTQYLMLQGSTSVDWSSGLPKRRPTKSNSRWVAWLTANGPATRKTIADAVGLLTGDVPPYADQLFDGTYPDDTMMRLSAENAHGHGRPVDVYFLWSQRFDLLVLFGVGPVPPPTKVISPDERDDLVDQLDSGEITADEFVDGIFESTDPECPILGVLQPPERIRLSSIEEWDGAWAALLDAHVAAETTPTDEQKQAMRDSLPEGAEPNAALAIAWRSAVERSRLT